MSLIKAGTELPYRITYLEMLDGPNDPAPLLPEGVRLDHAVRPPAWFFLALYDAVGRAYEWQDKHREDPEVVRAFVQDPAVELWVASAQGWPQGFFQLDFRQAGTCDLAYFGMVPEAVGQGLGGKLLRTALAKGWAGEGVRRMTVNTCTLDHPRALDLYQRVGFRPIRTEDKTCILTRDRDPSLFPA
ncbi:GNAT family N-acetyltransferase [Roseobacter sp. HKCCD9010]|uniref:GNAT family N-acetyltransferase n=1 Tax=unclassified Roseobacter TaxID=196798 RepID=UPI00149153C9|nr:MULTISPECIES: GNAT family N-acetyltransferase [unclassified Roseobacter]MBF9050939.1 GNAT family N-acetyltransferase [Rhodobacterales bacterium HKCCD4356]NNV12708.1 GNAT family N-acetyltransferase [Roseobacter sp. HKCCD7357]NNV16652.1 GNAT family N-acetyltransferase [Roseobacter sp. HKCCD8768]NNV26716.1 GNAT family N-acetyltransferase [Roseobacter sp. HKCCD8192]NNV30371.1 GNAT family N-acetyltransferase [Roseobacter sp. HKCCD9061]